ncbi:MAG: ABC transporter ATP-binding protein [Nitrospiraceae bacterium]|nr:ABC transporter ATP-binding protein [Nitrospiraceae bacterium]
MMAEPLLAIEDLRTYFYSRSKRAFIRSVDGVSLAVAKGETLGIVGESGSGKSITAMSVMGLVSAGPGVISGRIGFRSDRVERQLLEGLDTCVALRREGGRVMAVEKDDDRWAGQVEKNMTGIRGREISMIFQNPKQSLNPFETVGRQITEAIMLHTSHKIEQEAKEKAIEWLDRVKIDSPRLRFDNHPFGLSGGMCQRAMIAMALSCEPHLLIADEPTTGLDATIQSKIVDLLAELKSELGITTMLISHDIGIIGRLSDTVAVMYGGTVVESGPAKDVLSCSPEGKHPYTAALLASIPSSDAVREKGHLQAIEGDVLDTINIPAGCRFYGRCSRVTDKIREKCDKQEPDLREIASGRRVRCWLYFE